MGYHPDIIKLEDEGLVRACVLIRHHNLFPHLDSPNDWERKFLEELPQWWARAGSISWKQRRIARAVLTEITEELERRKALGDWIDEAKAL